MNALALLAEFADAVGHINVSKRLEANTHCPEPAVVIVGIEETVRLTIARFVGQR